MRKAVSLICAQPWAITQSALAQLLLIANREQRDIEAVETQRSARLANTSATTERGGVAIVPVTGPIFRYANLFSEMSGATSVQILARDFTTALNDPSVRAILLNIDSPGGEVNGVNEFAQMIYAARGKKPITAYVGGTGCSAAYWIASAADEIVADETAILGSIGVIAAIPAPESETAGDVVFVSSQSPRKHPDPTTPEGASDIQQVIDATAEVFINAIARNRGVTADTVLANFGQGGVFVGMGAVQAGIADRIGSFERTLAELARGSAIQTLHAIQVSGSDPDTIRANALFAVPAPSSPALDDTTRQPTKEQPMDETLNGNGAGADLPPTLPPDAPAAAVSQALAGMEEQLTARQMEMLQSRFTAMQEQANRNAEQLFLRWQADQEARSRMTTWAQHATTATLDRRHALSCPADELVALLAETPSGPRAKWQALLDRTLTNGFVSFEEIGSEGGADERDDRAKYDAAVTAKVAAGMSRVAAIQAVARENPDLYAAQAVKKGGR